MIFPTAYFPSIHYVRELCRHESVVIDQHEHWIKQSIRNRCEILTAEGIHRLIVPIAHNDTKQCMAEINISSDSSWQVKHWRAIKSAYGKAPYFEAYHLEIESILLAYPKSLWELNLQILKFLIDAWDLPVSLKQSTSFIPYAEQDLRHKNWLNREPLKEYQQVFSYDKPFSSNLSALDLLLCEGPMGRLLLLD